MKKFDFIKTVIHCAPILSILFIVFNTMFYFLTYLELRLIQSIVKSVSLKEERNFVFCIIALTICYIIQSIKSSFLQILKNRIQNKILSSEYNKIYSAVDNMNITDLDDSNNLLDINQAKQAVEFKYIESFLVFADIIGIVFNLIAVGIQLIKIQFSYLICFVIMAILQKLYNYYNNLDKVKLEKTVNPLFRKHRYFMELFTNKAMTKEIRSYQLYGWFENKRKKVYDNIMNYQLKQNKKWIKINSIVALMMYTLELAVYIIAIFQSIKGNISIDQIVFVIESNGIFISYYMLLMNSFSDLEINKVYFDSFNKIVNTVRHAKKRLQCTNIDNVIEMKNVSYSYKDDIERIKDINLNVKKGEKIVLLGENGSGKSTLVKLIIGLLEPVSGEIYTKGSQSIVFQDFGKYKFKVEENVFFGDLDEKENALKIKKVLYEVGAEKVIQDLPFGIETELSKEFSSDGVELSGGEWQKIAISRGFFRNADLFVLDEPTAALDPIAEINQLATLENVFESSSVIIVSHRVSIAKKADRVIFMKNGRISENGSFDELMAIKGDFYTFYNMQSKWYE